MVRNNWSIAVAQAWLAIYCFCAVFSGGSCCLRGWLQFEDRCYQFVTDSPSIFETARFSCRLKGAELASISSEDILHYITLRLEKVPGNRFWVGLGDENAPSLVWDLDGLTPPKWHDGTSTKNQSWILPRISRFIHRHHSCYMYDGELVRTEVCFARLPYICSYIISNNSATSQQRPCNPSVPSWTEETFFGDATGKCIFRLPDMTTKENAEAKCFEYWGDILDLDGILMDSMSVLHPSADEPSKARRMTNDGFRYWTDLRWNGTNILWSSGNTFGEEIHIPIIKGSGSCITVEFNFTETLEIYLYQTECNSTARVFCSGSAVTMTNRRTTTERPSNDPPSSMNCPEGYNWKAEGNYCYWETSFETERLSWSDAEKYCQSFGGHLASFHSKEEERIGLSFQYASLSHSYWIGLQLDKETETYKWTDGTPLDYNNWAPGHPDHKDKRLQCVSFEAKETYWTSSLCGILSWFVCKVPKQLNFYSPVLPTPTPPPLRSCDSSDGNSSLKSFYFDGACYFLISTPLSWHRAKQYCENEGAALVSIHSDEEIGFLLKLLYENSPESTHIWIGLNVLNSDESLQWADWSPVDLTYFDEVGSNNIQIQAKCCNMHNVNGIWSYDNCNAHLSFICKRKNDTSSVTIPSTPDPRIGNCKKGWVPHHDRCYYVGGQREKDRVNWTQALQICHEHGGYLTSIRDQNEQAFLVYLLQSLRLDAWIGLHDTIQTGRYYWLDNSDLQYTKWAIGEPSLFGMKEDCVKMVYNDLDSGVWKDDECDKAYGYICQTRKDPTLPEPDYGRGINCLQPEGWLKLDNMCFKIFGGNTLTWSDAERSCEREGGHLVSISDKSVKAVVSYLGSEVNQSFWIGLKYKESNQKLNWINGWPLTLSDWEKNEPGSIKPDTCFSSTSEGYWKKSNCEEQMPYVCQISTGKPTKPKMYTGNCPESSKLWTPGSGSYCYILHTDRRLDWFGANSICFRYGSHLTSIHSMSEIEDMKSLMKPGVKSVHIGLYKNWKGGFTWTDKTPVDFVNWDKEPDTSSSDQCVEMMADTMRWKVVPCMNKSYVICRDKKDTEFYENPESAKRTDDSSVRLSSGGITAIIVSITIVLMVIVAAAFYYSKTVLAKNRIQNPFRPMSSVSFENALYDVNTASMEFHDNPKSSL